MSLDAIDKERLDILAGARGQRSASKAAVRKDDLAAIPRLKPMASKQVSAAPTAADFNALQSDVAALYEMLAQIASRVK